MNTDVFETKTYKVLWRHLKARMDALAKTWNTSAMVNAFDHEIECVKTDECAKTKICYHVWWHDTEQVFKYDLEIGVNFFGLDGLEFSHRETYTDPKQELIVENGDVVFGNSKRYPGVFAQRLNNYFVAQRGVARTYVTGVHENNENQLPHQG